jgi:hypothetical protein
MLRIAIVTVLAFPAAAFFSWLVPLPFVIWYGVSFWLILSSKA